MPRAFIIRYLGSFFIILLLPMLIYNLWLAFSKYRSIRLGRVKPQYSTFGWIADLLCCHGEPAFYFGLPPEWAYYTVWLHPFGMDYEETADFLQPSFFIGESLLGCLRHREFPLPTVIMSEKRKD